MDVFVVNETVRVTADFTNKINTIKELRNASKTPSGDIMGLREAKTIVDMTAHVMMSGNGFCNISFVSNGTTVKLGKTWAYGTIVNHNGNICLVNLDDGIDQFVKVQYLGQDTLVLASFSDLTEVASPGSEIAEGWRNLYTLLKT